MKSDLNQSKVTIEDLLKLKRAERPPVEFWDNFDRNLRAKQLATMMEPKPWWLGLALGWKRFTPYALPTVGALAVLAVVFSVQSVGSDGGAVLSSGGNLRETASGLLSSETSRAQIGGTDELFAMTGDEAGKVESRDFEGEGGGQRTLANVEWQGDQEITVGDASVIGLMEAVMPQNLVAMLPGAGLHLVTDLPESTLSPSARTIAGNLPAAAEWDHSIDARLGVVRASLGESVAAFAGPAQPQVLTASTGQTSRQDRLLAVASAELPGNSERLLAGTVGERLTHRLDDDLIPTAVRRLGVGGNRVSLRF